MLEDPVEFWPGPLQMDRPDSGAGRLCPRGWSQRQLLASASKRALSLRSGRGRWRWEAGSCHSEGCCGWNPGPATPKRVTSDVTPACSGPRLLSHANAELGPESRAVLAAWPVLHYHHRLVLGTQPHGAPARTRPPAAPHTALLFKVAVVWLTLFLKNHSRTCAEFHKASCHH